MARPRKSKDEKRKLVGVRLAPPIYATLEQDAARSGRSLAHEVERRAAALAGLSEASVGLLEQIAGQIRTIEANTKNKWYDHLKTWAMVSEMLSKGPIQRSKPFMQSEEEELRAAIAPLSDLAEQRRSIVKQIQECGATVAEFERPISGLGVGLSVRRTECAAIGAIDDAAARQRASDLHDELKRLDQETVDALVRANEVMMLYAREEDEGRELYRKLLDDEVQRRRNQGEKLRIDELVGLF